MQDVFGYLFLITGLLFGIGMFNPEKVIRWGDSKTKKKVFLVYGIPMFVFFILTGTTAPELTPEQKTAREAAKQVQVKQETGEQAQQNNNYKAINAGMDAQIKKQCMVAATEDDFEEMAHDAAAKNEDAAKRMILRGTLWIVDKGTRVHVINKSALHGAKIEILDGTFQGRTGYIATDFLE